MTTKHTPGPWVITSYQASPPTIIAPGVHDICVMSGAATHDGVMADARLIAAAPELLEALQTLASYGNVFAYKTGDENPYEKAIAAIAKATGETA